MPGKSLARRPLRRASSAATVASSPWPSALTADIAVNTAALTTTAPGPHIASRWEPLPEIVEIEPVERVTSTFSFQPRGEARHQGLELVVARGARQADAL